MRRTITYEATFHQQRTRAIVPANAFDMLQNSESHAVPEPRFIIHTRIRTKHLFSIWITPLQRRAPPA